MSRRAPATVLLGTIIATAVSIISAGAPASASGGGGCPPPITNEATVRATIADFCYSPTVIHIKPGTTVTWTNKDDFPHSITGANRAWGGYRQLRLDDAVTYSFNQAGVYPYYCVIHVGMVGTVVVRDGIVPEASSAVDAVTRVRGPGALTSAIEVPAVPGVEPAVEPNVWPYVLLALVIALLGLPAILIRRIFSRR